MDFNVTSAITITSLGAYDSGGLAFTTPGITVGIYQRLPGGDPNSDHSGTLLTSLTITGSAGTISNNYRFESISSLTLQPGYYSVVAVGFNGTNLELNENIGGSVQANGDNGAISFVGTTRADYNTSLDFPYYTEAEYGFTSLSPQNYGAGSFLYSPAISTPEPSGIALLGLATIMFAGYYGWRRLRQLAPA